MVENLAVEKVIEQIRSGKYKVEIEFLRECLANGENDVYTAHKKKLTACTTSGTFSGGRKPDFMVKYSGMVILDIDHIINGDLALIRQKAIDEPLTFALFTSPGGKGLKILIRVNSDKEHHLKAFEQVKFHYEKLLGLEIDRTGKYITRLCFLSYDPEAWINPDS